MRRLLVLLLALATAPCVVAQISVFSPRTDAVSVTIYRDGLALITETRTVELPADAATLVFEGVVDRLIPQSAVVSGLARPLAESNFTFDELTPASLIKRSVGKTVTLIRTQPKTGKVTRTQAVIVSADRGVVLRTVEGNEALKCSGLPEHLEFSEIPGELTPKPVLSIRLAAGPAGKRTVKLSYLSPGFSWRSNYVGRLNASANRMALTGWVTLKNESSVSFKDAQVQLVAGKLNLLAAEEGGSRPEETYSDDDDTEPPPEPDQRTQEATKAFLAYLERLENCYPTGSGPRPPSGEFPMFRRSVATAAASGMLEEVMVTGSRVQREAFADYQLYRLPWPTDLNARQTKQAVFLEKPQVKVERFYSVKLREIDDVPDEPDNAPNLMVRWENKSANGLGEPLPAGRVRIFEPHAASDVFAGEAQMEDKPVGLPVELTIGRALNLSAEYEQEDNEQSNFGGGRRFTVIARHRFVNNKEVPVSIEVRHRVSSYYANPKVLKSNLPAGRKFGDLTWRFQVAPGAEQTLHYSIRATYGD